MRTMLLAVSLSLSNVSIAEDAVAIIRSGDVYLRMNNEKEARITHDGDYTEAKLSPNKRYVALIRKPYARDPDLVIRDVNAGSEREVLGVHGKIAVNEYYLPVYGDLSWSMTSDSLYFLLDFSGTSAYLAKVDLSTHRVLPICDAIHYVVVSSGKYRGKLAVRRRKHTLIAVWDWYWLIDDTCAEIGAIGTAADLQQFLSMYRQDQ